VQLATGDAALSDAVSAARTEQASRLQQAEEALAAARAESDILRSAQERLGNEVRVKEVQMADANESIRRLRRDLASARDDAAAGAAGHAEIIAELRAQLNDASAARDGERAAREDEAQRLADAEAQAHSARLVAAQLEAAMRELRADSATTEDRLRLQVAEKEAALGFVDKEIAQLRGAYEGRSSAATAERDAAVRRASELELALAAEKEAREAARAAVAEAARAEVSRARAAAEALAGDARAKVASVEAEMRVLLKELDRARASAAEEKRRIVQWLKGAPAVEGL
jgi:chromosome segregation ATPase